MIIGFEHLHTHSHDWMRHKKKKEEKLCSFIALVPKENFSAHPSPNGAHPSHNGAHPSHNGAHP